MTTPSDIYDAPDDLVPVLRRAATDRQPLLGRLTALNTVSKTNTVTVLGIARTNLAYLTSAEATLTVPSTVLLLPYRDTWVILGALYKG
jgi:hypothetical protein